MAHSRTGGIHQGSTTLPNLKIVHFNQWWLPVPYPKNILLIGRYRSITGSANNLQKIGTLGFQNPGYTLGYRYPEYLFIIDNFNGGFNLR